MTSAPDSTARAMASSPASFWLVEVVARAIDAVRAARSVSSSEWVSAVSGMPGVYCLASNQVPVGSPARAAPTLAVEASSTAVPDAAASFAAAILVPAPPVPTPADPMSPSSTPARSSSKATFWIGRAPGSCGRARVERIDVAEQHQQVRADQLAHQRREPVVVAEPDLMRRDRVVLVDDGKDAQTEQALHGALRVAARGRMLEVAGREQHLTGDDAVAGEALLIAVDQHVLADRGRGLLRRQVGGARVQLEIRHPGGDRAG